MIINVIVYMLSTFIRDFFLTVNFDTDVAVTATGKCIF